MTFASSSANGLSEGDGSSAWSYFNNVLKRPKYVVAPMVDQSELAWRMLSRAHGADLCYTPMIHASVFDRDPTYRTDFCQPPDGDRPLIAQFCANDPDTFVRSANQIVPYCDGVDLNLGCPQTIAKRGEYGAFLQDDWKKIFQLVNSVHKLCPAPISVKIRVFDDTQRTVDYAKMIEGAGAQVLAVHGRTREQKGLVSGLADWEKIRAVREAVSIPVIANGNIAVHSDIDACLAATGVHAVMSAEGNLHNPCIFEPNAHPCHWLVAAEYLCIVRRLACQTPVSCIRAHLFKLFHHSLHLYPEVRARLASSASLDDFDTVIAAMRVKCEPLHQQYLDDPSSISIGSLMLPHWLCQPYYRDSSVSPDPVAIAAVRDQFRRQHHRALDTLASATGWSKRRLRRLQRNNNDLQLLQRDVPAAKQLLSGMHAQRSANRQSYARCSQCAANPLGVRCVQQCCRACCKPRSYKHKQSCPSHNLWFGDKSELFDRMERKKKEREELNGDDQTTADTNGGTAAEPAATS